MRRLRAALLALTLSAVPLLSVLSPAPVAGQESHAVRGVVADSTGAGMGGAMVVALILPDTVLKEYTLSGGDGRFTLPRLSPGEYLLQVTMVGHRTLRQPFTVAAADLDAGTLRMEVLAVQLDPLVVSVDHVPFVNRGDTLDFNANAFTTRPNASVEELLARLPGIEVDEDGTIRAQGEEVRNVLVDGREFFGTDPTIATRNLPADAVERIQVYDRESDLAEFTGIADGQEERTINLQLRPDARSGYFGQAVGGIGGGLQPAEVMEAQPTGRTRYNESLNLFRFSPTTQLAFLGGANNVNEAGFAWGDFVSFDGGAQGLRGGGRGGGGGGGGGGGVQMGGGRNDGFTSTLAFGVNANRDFTEDRWLRTSYFYTGLDNVQRETTQQQQLLGSAVSAFQTSASDQTTANSTHRLNLNGQYAFAPGHDVRVRGNLNVGSSTRSGFSSSETTTLAGEFQNSGTSANTVEGSDLNGGARLTWRKRLGEGGRALVAEAGVNVQDPRLSGELLTTTVLPAPGEGTVTRDVIQEQERTGRTLSLTQRVALTQPLGGSTVLELSGERREVEEDQDNVVVDVGSGIPIPNPLLSSGFERSYTYLSGGVRLSRNTEGRRLMVGVQLQDSRLEGVIRGRDEDITNRFTNVLPSAQLRWQPDAGKTFDLRWVTSTREPSMTELQPFADNTNPTRIYVGNPDLVPEYRHTLNAEYRFFDAFTFLNLFTYLRLSWIGNDIVLSRTTDAQALQTVRPVNIDHTWSTTAGVTWGRPIRPLGVQASIDYGVNHSRGVEFLNEDRNNSRSWRHSIDLGVDNRRKEIVDLRVGARFALNDVAYSLNPELDQSYLDRTFYGSGRVELGSGWSLGTELNYRLFDQEVFGTGTRDVALLQASASRRMLDDRLELSLVGFDLLDQNRGVSFSNGSSFIREQRTESMGRYVMLRGTWRLGSLGGRGAGMGRGGGRR